MDPYHSLPIERYFYQFQADDSYDYNLPSSKILASMPLYAKTVGHWVQGEKYFTERSHSVDFLLLYTLRGKGVVRYQSHNLILPPNHMVLVDCDRYHHYYTCGDLWDLYFMQLSGVCARTYYNLLYPDNSFCSVPFFNASLMQSTVCNLIDTAALPAEISALRNALLVTQIMTECIETARKNAQKATYPAWIFSALEYIHSQYSTKIYISELAKTYHISESLFTKSFKKILGMTPTEYILSTRLKEAMSLLINTTDSIEEIAYRTGFSTPSLFSQKFKEALSVSPSVYRRQNQKANFDYQNGSITP